MHTLQTGWCFYSGLEAAKRSNVWVASQSPAALAMLAAAGAAAGNSPASDRSRPPSESLMQVHTTHFVSFAWEHGTKTGGVHMERACCVCRSRLRKSTRCSVPSSTPPAAKLAISTC